MVGSGKRNFKLKELGIIAHHHESEKEKRKGVIRRGCLAIKVGREEKERIEVPVSYLKHPLFLELLKEAEEEYGFEQEGAIAIPCQLQHFKCVEAIILSEQHHHHHHHRLVGCFKPLS